MRSRSVVLQEVKVVVRDIRWILIATVLISILSWAFAEVTRWAVRSNEDHLNLLRIGWAVCILLLSWVLVMTLRKAFRPAQQGHMILTILFSYVAILFSFTAIYYTMVVAGDLQDAHGEYVFYTDQRAALESGALAEPIPWGGNYRAFSGIQGRIWSGPSHLLSDLHQASGQAFPALMVEVIDRPARETYHYETDSRLGVLLDCFHFSVVTMTTVGYGDISPRVWYSRLAADIQIVSALLVFAVGMQLVLGGWFREEEDQST